MKKSIIILMALLDMGSCVFAQSIINTSRSNIKQGSTIEKTNDTVTKKKEPATSQPKQETKESKPAKK